MTGLIWQVELPALMLAAYQQAALELAVWARAIHRHAWYLELCAGVQIQTWLDCTVVSSAMVQLPGEDYEAHDACTVF